MRPSDGHNQIMAVVLALVLMLPFRIESGPYAGAYRLDADGAVNWYFATTAFLRLRHLPLSQTRAYLDAYLAHLDPDGGIADVLPMPSGVYAPIAPDSEDAYAGTLLSLAVRYLDESHDLAWWHDSVPTLQAMAYAKLLTQVKANGLIRASGTDGTGYLMDNVEDYAGLRAFAGALRATHAGEDAYVGAFVAPLGAAIHRLYDDDERAFRWSDGDPLGPFVAYPSCAAQAYPQLYDVHSGDRRADAARFASARAALAHCRFSFSTSPHEALLYALYITRLARPTDREAQFLAAARRAPVPRDLVTISLHDAIKAMHRSS